MIQEIDYIDKIPSFSLYPPKKTRLNEIMGAQQEEMSNFAAKKNLTESKPVTFDDLLVAVGQSRNRDAFIRLFEYFAPRVKSFLMRGGLSAEQADELAQETMLTVWHKAGSYDARQARASTWIFTVARNKKIDWLRRQRPEHDPGDPVADVDTLAPDDVVSKTEEAAAVAQAIAELPPEQADIIRKAFFEDKTHREIAEETNLPLGTVKSRIRLAVDRLQHSLEGLKS